MQLFTHCLTQLFDFVMNITSSLSGDVMCMLFCWSQSKSAVSLHTHQWTTRPSCTFLSVCALLSLRPGGLEALHHIAKQNEKVWPWRMDSHFTNFNFGPSCFPAFFFSFLRNYRVSEWEVMLNAVKYRFFLHACQESFWILWHIVIQNWSSAGLCVSERFWTIDRKWRLLLRFLFNASIGF